MLPLPCASSHPAEREPSAVTQRVRARALHGEPCGRAAEAHALTTPKKTKPLIVSGTQFAALVGVHPKTISGWVALDDAIPHARIATGLRIDIGEGFRWLCRRDKAEMKKARAAGDPVSSKNAKLAAEARLKELDLAEREKKMISADEVVDGWLQIVVAAREAVLAIPGVAVQAGIVDPKNEVALDAIVFDTLTAISKGKK